MSEPKITINGVELNEGQAMAVRCAVARFTDDMFKEAVTGSFLGGDEHGKVMTIGYSKRLQEVRRLMTAQETRTAPETPLDKNPVGNCPACGSFQVDDFRNESPMRGCCRRCGHQWTTENSKRERQP